MRCSAVSLVRRLGLALLLLLTGTPAAFADEPAKDDKELPTITFSNLVYRLEGSNTDFGFFKDDLRVLLLETMRNEGFRGVGVESLVFQRDDSAKADFVLGGTLREAVCNREGSIYDCCRVGVDWELLDVVRDDVVYRHRSRYGECHLASVEAKETGQRLVIGALRSLLQRERFMSELKSRKEQQVEKPYTPTKIARCKPAKIAMTKSGDAAIDASVIVQSGKGHGSGFLLNPSGFIMTAAHVVTTNEVTVKTRDGISYRAKPVRISRKFDVALLKAELSEPLAASRCLSVLPEQQRAGAEIYAIGAPASEELGFSLTRGIVSGLRLKEGVHYLQTDTPVSPGNSGGPLVDTKGRAIAVVVSKLAGEALEGIGFGIPIDIAFRALALTQDAKTDAALETAPAISVSSDRKDAFVDPADPVPTLKRDQGRLFIDGTNAGASVEKRKDPQHGFTYLQGWFYLAPNLELYIVAAPTASKDRVSVRLRQKWGTSDLDQCKEIKLVVNGREYAPLTSKVEAAKSMGRERVEQVEGQFDWTALRRVREHAPTITVRGCGKSWTLAPKQLATVRKLVNEHEAMVGDAQ